MLYLVMKIKSWFSTYLPTTEYKMKRFEILDLIEDLGFQYLATMLDENELSKMDAYDHVFICHLEMTEEEFPKEIMLEIWNLLDLFFSL